MKKLHWIEIVVICITAVFAIFCGITASKIVNSTFIIGPLRLEAIPLIFVWMGILWVFFTILLTFLSARLSHIEERVNLQCEHDLEIGRTLSDIVKYINEYLQKPRYHERLIEASKRLNGIKYKLEQGTLEEQTATTIIRILKKDGEKLKSFQASSTFPIEWWFQPEWLFYLMNQLILCKEKNIKACRFTIYEKIPDIQRHKREYINFIDTHNIGSTDLIILLHSEVYTKMESLIKALSISTEDKKDLRDFIHDYLKRSQKLSPYKRAIFPDGWILKYENNENKTIYYLRDPSSGVARRVDNPKEQKALENFFNLLHTGLTQRIISRITREDVEAI